MLTSRKRNQDGAAMVEFALVFTLVSVLIFAVIEVSLFVHDHIVTSRMSREAAMAASISGSLSTADYYVLQSIVDSARTVNMANIQDITVYRASSLKPNQLPDKVCETKSVKNLCNHYSSADLVDPIKTDFGCFKGVSPTKKDANFCPEKDGLSDGRNDSIDPSLGAGGGTELIGVRITYYHHSTIGLFGNAMITSTSTARVEPAHYA